MIASKDYLQIVKLFYSFLESEFDLGKVHETMKGNAFYDVEFWGNEKVVSVSYESIEDHLEVIVFRLQNGKLPDYNDKVKTLHLGHLNESIMAKASVADIKLNAEYFEKYSPMTELERKLLKGAKERRLCLKHLQ